MLKKLEWDSNFFEREIYKIDSFKDIDGVNKNNFKNGLIQICIEENEKEEKEKIREKNFKYIVGHMTLKKDIYKSFQSNENVVEATIEDLEDLKRIVKGLYEFSRFNEINSKKVDSFYQEWIRKAILKEYDDICFIYKEEKRIIGFVTLKKNKNSMIIGLIGVDKKNTSHGIGKELIKKTEEYAINNNCKTIEVTTQSENKRAVKFYNQNGFSIVEKREWFYYERNDEND